jgi:hypothetical protein
MPFVKKPKSSGDHLTWLRRMSETGAQDQLQERAYLPQSLLTELAALVPIFETALMRTDETLAGRIRETAERQSALARLETYVRDYWQGLLRRTAREGHSVEVLRMHGLPVDGQLPHPTRDEEWLIWAERIVAGDAQAVAAGLPPMANPASAEVQTVLDQASTEAADVSEADRVYDEAQAALSELRGQASDLIDQVVTYLQLALRKLDPSSQRRIMRTYGVVFVTYEGEVLPEDEELAAPDVPIT